MLRLRKYRKPIIILVGIFLFWIVSQLAILIFIGDVNYKSTIRTNYHKKDSITYIISTSWANIPTKEKFINISNEPTCPGFVGSFIASYSNLINYEYGLYSPQLSTFEEMGYKSQTDTVNGRIIFTVFKDNETGFIIPWQDDMSYSFLLYPSKYGTKHQNEIKNSLANIEFKK
ncbi:hypothetical protein [Marinigracilibium pacificum]|uniref:Uncharacterized protein n=1 Tax=Marinigracilibium pacificum TaxID=2729599 RepID=A0A848IZG6_9BACT|nr:hypothetical protein [Marinigracilibium pacificum]NMM47614.1 hypothetical protein [Marinigracilibium pacificum]